MKTTSPVLTISMLISGKEDMPKSLASLRYFKDAIPCEIILVDTGCSPEQRALAEQYADKIIDFVWRNDFAAARNAGLKEATGEWFLYLDDDEWFENPQEIIAFFRTGEYRAYNSAAYVIRNYTDLKGTFYEDSCPVRMVRLTSRICFTGKIHESLAGVEFPRKLFNDFVHHYGYAYRNDEERKKHAERNIIPLLELRRECPGDPRWVAQLAQEYFSIKEYEKVLQDCEKGLEEWEALEDKGSYSPVFIGAIYAFILITLDSMDRHKEEKVWLERAFEDPMSKLAYMLPTRAFYCMAGARLYCQTKEYEICTEYFRRYINCARDLKDQKEILELGTELVVEGVFQEQILYGTVLLCLGAAVRTGAYELAEEAFSLLDWQDQRLLKQQRMEADLLDACCGREYHPCMGRMLQALTERDGGMAEMHVVFLKTEIDYQNQNEAEKLLRLHRIVSELGTEHHYILYTKLLWNMENPELSVEEKKKNAVALFAKLFQMYPEKLLETRGDVWETAEQLEIPLEPFLLGVRFSVWKHEAEDWARETDEAGLRKWEKRITGWKRNPDVRYDFFFMLCAKEEMKRFRKTDAPQEAQRKRLEELLIRYSDCAMLYYERIYTEETFAEKAEILPEEAELAYRLKSWKTERERGNRVGVLRAVKDCIGICQELEAVMEEYADMLREEEAAEKAAEEELFRVAGSLKKTARMRLEQGDVQTAELILKQIAQCLPEDAETRELLCTIQSGKN